MRLAGVLFGLAALSVGLMWQAPASLFDEAAAKASAGRLRITSAAGTVWQGEGVLTALDPVTRTGHPWMALEWTFDPRGLLAGALSWRILSGGRPLMGIEFSRGGIAFGSTHLTGPARFFMEQIPGSVGRAGWTGDVSMNTAGFRCTWRGSCEGRLEVKWLSAASDLLPGQSLGDYELATDGVPSGISFSCHTLKGGVRIEGRGTWLRDAAPTFKGTVRGDAEFLQQLPNVAGPWIRPAGEPGAWIATYP